MNIGNAQRSGISLVLLTILRAAILVLLASGAVQAATLTVTNTNDSGAGSLRQAIADAAASDTIVFGVTGAITLASQLDITRNLTISGPGAGSLALDGGGAVRLIQVSNAANFTLLNLTLTNGSEVTGGALADSAGTTTTITGCAFSNNRSIAGGGAIIVWSSMTIADSTFSGNIVPMGHGGALYAPGGGGVITIGNTVFSNNSSSIGGAIVNGATMTLNGVNLSGNTASAYGGGIYSDSGVLNVVGSTFAGNSAGNGGGIEIGVGATVAIQNSTFSGNLATTSGGGIDNYGGLTVRNTSLSSNSATTGGGIHSDASATLTMRNTLIANSPSGGDCSVGAFGTNDRNLVEDGSCSPALSGDPKLGALANNGGATQTLALLAGSVAIDAGNNATCLATDQRGVARPQGATCDIGAYEAPPTPAPASATSIPTLSEWGLLLLSTLVGLLGLARGRGRASGTS